MRRARWRTADVRVLLIGVIFLASWFGIGYRLWAVQGANAAEYAQRGFDQRVRHEEIEPPRGTIYDRDGVELAITVTGATVIADPELVEDPAHTAELLAPVLGADYVDVAQKLGGDGRFVYLARRIEHAIADEVHRVVEENDLSGVTLIDEYSRVYPAGSLAAHVLGLTRIDDGAGIEGIELIYDDELAGEPGTQILERDPSGRVIPQAEMLIEPAAAGSDIVLTLDRDIQYIVERALADALIRTGAIGATAVVLRVGTGEILAMASAPSFDPMERSSIPAANVRNRAVSEVFEPGSTLKSIVVAGAIEEGIVAPDIAISTPELLEIGEHSYEDPGDHPDKMSVADVLAYSSNTGAINIQRLLGDELHYQYLDAFGLGRPASIDFPGEASGDLPHVEAWCETCGPSAAIGYGVSVTTLQLAAAYATIANDGEWVEPYVVAEILETDGTSQVTEPRRHRAISAETALTMRRMLMRVVDIGTGTRAAVDGYSAAGKTGTTERFDVDLKAYSETDTIANFIGMAPVEDPQVVIAIVLDTPRGMLEDGTEMRFAAASAAPVFSEIAEPVLHLLGVAPDRPLDEE